MKYPRISVRSLALLVSLSAVACGSSSSPSSAGATGTDGGKSQAANPCGLHTSFDGDENCILPPEDGKGLQLHVGPSSYDDPAVINAMGADGKYLWQMVPGDERTECYHMLTPNDQEQYYFEQKYRMRTGSHHMIIENSGSTSATEEWLPCPSGQIAGSIGGTQHPIEDLPPGGKVAPEDAGLGRKLAPHSPLDIQLHFYNTTDHPRLREAWVNFIYKPQSEVTGNLGMLGAFTYPLSVLAGQHATVGNVCKAEKAVPDTGAPQLPARIVTLFAHAHTHNKRFVVYHDKADGSSDVVYDSYDGAESPTYTYDTVVKNAVADPQNRVSGGSSGLLTLQAGEQLRFLCDIANTTTFDFHGKNEVNTDEMCNLFGTMVGIGMPCFDAAPPKPPTWPATP